MKPVTSPLLSLLLLSSQALAGDGAGKKEADAAAAVMAAIAQAPEDPLPGYAGAVGIGDRIVYSGGAGLADLGDGRAATPQTRFRIYSTAKSMGAVAAMRLSESGKLDLDARVSTYLKDLPAHIGVVTVRQILAHRSGIRHYREGEWDRVSNSNCTAPKEALSAFINDPLEFEPGSDYKYTTFGYVLLSAVLEAAAGQPFDELVHYTIFKPAGMTATAIEGRPIPGHDVAAFYDRSDAGAFSPTAGVDASCKFFGGGLVSTAEDMVRFGLALVNGRLVSQASLQQMLSIHSEGGGNYPPYGYGFIPGDGLTTTFGVPAEDFVPNWWHGGNGRGGYSVLIIYPERRAAAAIATNVRASGRLVRATHSLALPFLRKQEANRAAASAYADAMLLPLQLRTREAIARLRSLDAGSLDASAQAILACMEERFGDAPRADIDARPQSVEQRTADGVIAAYQRYWRQALLSGNDRASLDAASATLLSELRSVLGTQADADWTRVDEGVQTLFERLDWHTLRGMTPPLRELIVWGREDVEDEQAALPDGPEAVRVVFMSDFKSRGWAHYATCGRSSAGGWTGTDRLHAVTDTYDRSSERYRVSYLAHEGQHFRDKRRFTGANALPAWRLEYRAKLVELALARERQADLLAVFASDTSEDPALPHSHANHRVMAELDKFLPGHHPWRTAATWTEAEADALRSAARALLASDDSDLRARASKSPGGTR